MKHHPLHFIVLVTLLGIGTTGFFLVQGNQSLQFFIGVLTSLSYIVWGLLHHAIQKDLHPKVVIEYVLIAVIAIMLLILLIGA